VLNRRPPLLLAFLGISLGLLVCGGVVALAGPATPGPPVRPIPTVAPRGEVEIFVTSWCPYCRALEGYLKSKGVPFRRYDIEHDSAGMVKYERLGGGGVPIATIGATIIRGFDPVALDRALATR